MHLVVDGMNVIGSRPTGWWRDRAKARRELVGELTAARPTLQADELTVVFDGRPGDAERAAADEAPIEVRFAPGGPNAADDAIVELIRQAPDPGAVTVVTSDGALSERVRRAGASVEGVGSFRRRLADLDGSAGPASREGGR